MLLRAAVLVICAGLVMPGLAEEESFGERSKVTSDPGQARIRQGRAYNTYPYQQVSGGYGYKPPTTTRGYIYTRPTTTTTTTPEPAIESEADIDSQYITPAPPPPVYPEKEFESSPVVDDSPDEWDIRDSVPGSPGENYPTYGAVPKTGFRCEGRIPGYYADPETRCQVFHRCSDSKDNVRLEMDSFICPNGTQFNQEIYACDWWQNVHCDTANVNRFYSLNQELNALGSDGEYLKFSGVRQAPAQPDKIVAPRIIPKEERRPLAPQYRSGHKHSDGDGSQHDSVASPSRGPIVRPTQPPQTLFNEFRKPTTQSKPVPVSSNTAIDTALNNPDYFNPDPIDPRKVEQVPATSDAISDDDYFNSDIIETRSNIVEGEGNKLDNDPLNPPTTTPKVILTTPKETSTTTGFSTTIVEKTTLATTSENPTTPFKEIEFGDRKLQPIIPFQRQLSDEKPEGFIVNRAPSNILPNEDDIGFDFNEQSNSDQTPTRVSGTTQPVDDYLPPRKDYLPPTTTTAAPVYLPPSTQASPEYLPPSTEQPPSYLPPTDTYLPPQDTYLPPKDSYLPPQQQLEQDSYAPLPDSYYRKPSSGYGAPVPLPAAASVTYGEPPVTQGWTPVATNLQYPGYSVVQPAPLVFSNFMASNSFQFQPSQEISGSSYEVVQSPLLSYNHVTSESQPNNYFSSPSADYYQGEQSSYSSYY